MSKKASKKAAKRTTKAASQSVQPESLEASVDAQANGDDGRGSFFPGEAEASEVSIETRPGHEELPRVAPEDELPPLVSVVMDMTSDTSGAIELTIGPLSTVREPLNLPRNASPEQKAAIMAAAMQRAAGSAHNDGIYQHAVKEQQRALAEDRARGIY